MGNLQGLLQLVVGLLSLFGAAGLPRNYVGGITQIVSGIEALFAAPHEVGAVAVAVTPVYPTEQAPAKQTPTAS